MQKALIVIDVQNDFGIGGALECEGLNEIVPKINELMEKGGYDLIVGTQDWHPANHVEFEKWGVHCLQNSRGSLFIWNLKYELFNVVLRKGMSKDYASYSAFRNENEEPTGLYGILESRIFDEIHICGVATDVCVWATRNDCCDLFPELDRKIFVISDCCVGTSEEKHWEYLSDMRFHKTMSEVLNETMSD